MSAFQPITLRKTGMLVFDFDDVFFPRDNGTHAQIKKLITQNVVEDLGPNSVLALPDAHGHLPYFPQYVLYKYIQTGRNADDPEFVRAMEKCYFGENTHDPEHYRVITHNPELRAQFMRLKDEGADMVILTSGPYNPHVKGVLERLGVAEFFPRENVYDITRMCDLYTDVTLEDFANPVDEKLLRWMKPKRENYLAMTMMAGLEPGSNLYFEDNDVNGSGGVTARKLSQESLSQLQKKFGLPEECWREISAISDSWVWINKVGQELRDGNTRPVCEMPSLEEALSHIQIEQAPHSALKCDAGTLAII